MLVPRGGDLDASAIFEPDREVLDEHTTAGQGTRGPYDAINSLTVGEGIDLFRGHIGHERDSSLCYVTPAVPNVIVCKPYGQICHLRGETQGRILLASEVLGPFAEVLNVLPP